LSDFKEPRLIENTNETKSFVNVTGQIKKITYRGETYDFYKKNDFGGKISYEFTGDVLVGDNRIRVRGLNSQARPTFAKELSDTVKDGDWVKISGFLDEYKRDGKARRVVKINKLEKIEQPDGAKLSVILKGKILSFEEKDDRIVLVIGQPKFNKVNEYNEFEVMGAKADEYSKWLINQKPVAGDFIEVKTKPINMNYQDENNDWVTKNYNLILGIEAFKKAGQVQTQQQNDELPPLEHYGRGKLPF
jgi:hypothetical protein